MSLLEYAQTDLQTYSYTGYRRLGNYQASRWQRALDDKVQLRRRIGSHCPYGSYRAPLSYFNASIEGNNSWTFLYIGYSTILKSLNLAASYPTRLYYLNTLANMYALGYF